MTNRLHRYIGIFVCMVLAGSLLVGWLIYRAVQTDTLFKLAQEEASVTIE